MWTLRFTCPNGSSEKRCFVAGKYHFLERFLPLSERNLAECRKFFGNVVTAALSVSIGSFSGKKNSLKLFLFFQRTLSKKNWPFAKKSWYACQNCILRVQSLLLRKQIWEIRFLSHSRTWSEEIFGLVAKVFLQWCQTCNLSVYRNILRIFFGIFSLQFSSKDFEQKITKLLAKATQHGCRTCILHDHKNFLRKKWDFLFFFSWALLGSWRNNILQVVHFFQKCQKLQNLYGK